MMKRLAVCIPIAATLAGATPAAGQTAQRFSAQASALFVTLSGDAYESLKNGPGFEAQIRFNPGAFSVGGGFQFSNHDIDDEAIGTPIDGSVKLYGAFFEPRYVIATQSTMFAPYLSGRLAYLRQSLDVEGAEGKANGFQINGGGGLLFRLTTNVNVDLGATFGYIDFKEAEVSGGATTADPDSGTNWVFRLGLAFGLGR